MTGIAAVRAWPLDQFTATARSMGAGAGQILEASARVQNSVQLAPTWQGATRDAVVRRIAAQTATAKRLVRLLESTATAGGEAGTELTAMRARLLQLVDTATGAGFRVADDGGVTHPSPRRRTDAQYLGSRIGELLARLRQTDDLLAQKLMRLAGLLDGDGSLIPLPGGGTADPSTAITVLRKLSQDQRRTYWDSLSPGEIQALIDADPKTIGNLYGVPFADRITANRLSIQRALEAERAHLGTWRGNPRRVEELAALLRPVPGVDGRPTLRKLVAFDHRGYGRYIEQVGDLTPDASGVGVLVPGTGSNLANSDDQRRRALELARRSGVPILVYSDGRVPQTVLPESRSLRTTDPIKGTAMDGAPARVLGRRLAAFGQDLDAEVSAAAPGARTTYIGHSYGGSVVGTAEQYGLRADNVVFASSAGTGAGDGPWRDPNPDVRRYSMTAPGDPIHWAQRFGATVHGGDPDVAPGVQRLDTGFDSRGQLIQGKDGHSNYFDDPGSTAFGNLVAVLSGREPAPYVERAPDLPEAPESQARRMRDAGGEILGDLVKDAVRDGLRLPRAPGLPVP
ncbi:alpha/beta hydrolase [Gordonia caeni]|uniref:Alpha/beta hydrolase n=1 Tax=Gordonia caeni TaxID=1007097 RepID=A0ABP7PQ46_9ACTN